MIVSGVIVDMMILRYKRDVILSQYTRLRWNCAFLAQFLLYPININTLNWNSVSAVVSVMLISANADET